VNPIVFAIPVFLASILLEVWVARRRGVKAYDAADALTSLHLGVLSQSQACSSNWLHWASTPPSTKSGASPPCR
jgi:hypothetical protein